MALMKTWYDPAEASDKFGVPVATILEWVEEGLVRCERGDGEEGAIAKVNIDDVKLEMQSYVQPDS